MKIQSVDNKIFLVISLFGIFSGFSIMISGNTLNFWLSKKHIDIQVIGIFSIVSIPYALSWIWSPIFDTKKVPILHDILGNRLAWLLCMQILLCISTYILSTLNPLTELYYVAILGCFISLFASAQDNILGALRTELVDSRQQVNISGVYILGYRVGMFLSGSLAIYISQYLSWNIIYRAFSFVILIYCILIVCVLNKFINAKIKQPTVNLYSSSNISYTNLIHNILKPLGSLKHVCLILLFLVLYRLPDNFISTMINPFLIDIGYNELEISISGKFFGILGSVIGGLVFSYTMQGKNIYDTLFKLGAIHGVSHLFLIIQSIYGKNIYLLFIVTWVESITGGMTMAAYISYIASLCSGQYRATQYCIFSSMMGLSRSILPTLSGYIAVNFGWIWFYTYTVILTLPSLWIIRYLKHHAEYNINNAK